MTNAYFLEQAYLDSRKAVPISEGRYLALKRARDVLSEALDFEQRYELLVGNFIAMELAFTEMNLRSAVEKTHAYPDLAKVLQESNRQLANILTAAKSYIDQVVQDFKLLKLSPSFEVAAKAKLAQQFDASLEYRFMEALRNHTQHHAFPATRFEGTGPRADPNDWVERLQISASKASLFADKKFKRKFLEDLPDVIDLRAMSREYVRRIGIVHFALRSLVSHKVANARNLFEVAIRSYSADGGSSSGLCARKDGDDHGQVNIFTDWDDVRVKLAAKNTAPPDLWPRPRGDEPIAGTVTASRLAVGYSIEAAAASVSLQPVQWARYEAGLRIPSAIYSFYLLQTGQHPTHVLTPRNQSIRAST